LPGSNRHRRSFLNFLKVKSGLLSWLYDLTILATIISGLQYIWLGWSSWRKAGTEIDN